MCGIHVTLENWHLARVYPMAHFRNSSLSVLPQPFKKKGIVIPPFNKRKQKTKDKNVAQAIEMREISINNLQE